MSPKSIPRSRWFALFAGGCLLLCAADLTAVEFVRLGHLAGRHLESWANGVSGDGRVVVGESGGEAFRWTAEDGMIGLGDLPGGRFESRANAASFDGSVIVGQANDELGNTAFRWTESEGIVGLSSGAAAADVSADGTVIVGWNDGALMWKQGEGLIRLPAYDCCPDSVRPTAISADASVVVGEAYVTSTFFEVRWIDGVPSGPFLPANSFVHLHNTSADGSMIVGVSEPGNDSSAAFRWTEAEGLMTMPAPLGSYSLSSAFAVSADGTVIAGYTGRIDYVDFQGNIDAAVWDETRGWRRIDEILIRGGVDLAGWHLSWARDISADGRVVVGRGINSDGNTEAWLAVIPEPPTLLMSVPLVVIGICAVRKEGRDLR